MGSRIDVTKTEAGIAAASCSSAVAATPYMIVSDNGIELTSNAILAWQEERQVE